MTILTNQTALFQHSSGRYTTLKKFLPHGIQASLYTLEYRIDDKKCWFGQWLCGSVGRAVASDTRGPRFESSH